MGTLALFGVGTGIRCSCCDEDRKLKHRFLLLVYVVWYEVSDGNGQRISDGETDERPYTARTISRTAERLNRRDDSQMRVVEAGRRRCSRGRCQRNEEELSGEDNRFHPLWREVDRELVARDVDEDTGDTR